MKDEWRTTIGVVWFVIGLVLGASLRSCANDFETVHHGCTHYDATTGDLVWNDGKP